MGENIKYTYIHKKNWSTTTKTKTKKGWQTNRKMNIRLWTKDQRTPSSQKEGNEHMKVIHYYCKLRPQRDTVTFPTEGLKCIIAQVGKIAE